ncbi:MAG: hypothetical protein AB9888_15445 [Bacteroidales bacterium]
MKDNAARGGYLFSLIVILLIVRVQSVSANDSLNAGGGFSVGKPLFEDTTPPTNPTTIIENGFYNEGPATTSDVWQNFRSDPMFVLSGASDVSGIQGYYIYFGKEAFGTSTEFRLAGGNSTYNYFPQAVIPGTYYLRVSTRDKAGNKADWATLFVFRYDPHSPSTPTHNGATDLSGSTISVWQNTINSPNFVWSESTEILNSPDNSGVVGYKYYWGNDLEGVCSNFTPTASYAPAPVESGVYYLRLASIDAAGNESECASAYTFKYDNTSPTLAPNVPIADGLRGWYVTAPTFTVNGADAHSGLASAKVSLNGTDWVDSVTLSETTGQTVYFKTVDNTGNENQTNVSYKLDATPPSALGAATDSAGSFTDTWQKATDDPDFTWAAAIDTLSEVSYLYYWGKDEAGVCADKVNTPAYNPSKVSEGTYYLRAQSMDQAGNKSACTTIYTFRYDATAPTMSGFATDLNGSTNDVWQKATAKPSFSWPKATEDLSGISGYLYYWGTDEAGLCETLTPYASYDAPQPVTSGVYYLRVKSVDVAGNQSACHTVYTFKYDAIGPSMSGVATDLNGSSNDIWQRTTADPSFTWPEATDYMSGVSGYYYYWGNLPSGNCSSFTAITSYDPSPVSNQGTYFLRVQAIDQLGNTAPCTTIYTFRYDPNPPFEVGAINLTDINSSQSIPSNSLIRNNSVKFDWNAGSDYAVGSGSGLLSYKYYWGADSEGVCSSSTTSLEYTPHLENSGTYYFKVQAVDNAGNLSDVSTFTIRYDGTSPSAPGVATDLNGSVTDTWQNLSNDPKFVWGISTDDYSGVSQYIYYWGTDSEGECAGSATTVAEFDPAAREEGTHYLRVKSVDAAGNQSACTTVYIFRYEKTKPSVPGAASDSTGSIDNVWQKTTGNPSFTWTAATDGMSGVSSYLYYWGSNQAGICATSTASAAYDPPAVTSGTYYLRVQAVDAAGNQSDCSTIYTFLYDAIVSPVSGFATDLAGSTNNVWQRTISDPSFTWSAVTDDQNVISNYLYYWGTDAAGVCVASTTTPAYNPDAVTTGVYYLRVQAMDTLGNQSACTTIYTFKYDSAGIRVDVATDTSGSSNNVWQKTVNDPAFTWKASSILDIASYTYYWGTDEAGECTNTTTAPEYDPSTVTEGTYYLRVKAIDVENNRSECSTVYTFRYDATAPEEFVVTVTPNTVYYYQWQNKVNNPQFTWGAAADSLSGVAGYKYYWGQASNGACTNITTSTGYVPAPVSGGTYYFKYMAFDAAGNDGNCFTAFIFRYDATAPAPVTGLATDSIGSITNVWQNTVNKPRFTWTSVFDTETGSEGYKTYWGTNPSGDCTSSAFSASYGIYSALSSGTYYLRVKSVDSAGNASECRTLYIFKYDKTSPDVTPNAPVVDGLNGWYVSTPTFKANGSDAHSGLASAKVSLNGTDWLDSVSLDETDGQVVYFKAVDAVGNENQTSVTYKRDTTVPSVPGAVSDASGSVNGTWQKAIDDPNFTWAAATDDASGISDYLYYWGKDEAGACTTSTTELKYKPPSVAESGTYYLRVSTKDAAGNQSACTTLYTFKYDNIAPTVTPNAPVADGGNDWYVSAPTFTANGADVHSGLASAKVSLNGTDWLDSVSLDETNGQVVYFKAVDAVGNENQTSIAYKRDATAPSVPGAVSDVSGSVSGTWQKAIDDPNFTWAAATDATSGVSSYLYYWGKDEAGACTNPTTELKYNPPSVAESGTYYLRVSTKDVAGNESACTTIFSFRYDVNPPSVAGAATDSTGSVSGTWQKSIDAPNFTWATATDATSGVSSYLYYWGKDEAGACTNSTTELKYNPSSVAGSGTYYLRVSTKDAAGNESACITTYIFKYDKTSPAVTPNAPVMDGLNGWYVSAPTFMANGADAHSGLASAKVSLNGTDWLDSVSLDETNGQAVYFKAVDAAGNETQTSVTYKRDATAPSVPGAVSDASGSVSGTWQKSIDAPNFTWVAATDETSGISNYLYYWGMNKSGGCSTPTPLLSYAPGKVLNSGTYYLRVKSVDSAGNESKCTTIYTFKYDNAPPDISLKEPVADGLNGWYVSAPTFTASGADVHSGLASAKVSLNGTDWLDSVTLNDTPEQSVYFKTVDVVGNERLTSIIYKRDATAPSVPGSVSDASGSVNGTWQKSIDDPNFTWAAATDATSGVSSYLYYWGKDEAGACTIPTTELKYNPSSVAESGTYYLRGSTKDVAGNQSACTTLYTFKYDNIAPTLTPSVPAVDGLDGWYVSAPIFTANGADVHSGLASAKVSLNGTDWLDSVSLSETSGQTIYFRTLDNAGNESQSSASYKFDKTAPSVPGAVSDASGSVNGTWQKAIDAPNFTWAAATDATSGVSSYLYYWGTDEVGACTNSTTDLKYNPDAVTSGTYYLRARAKDAAGNKSSCDTIYTFKYDNIAPTLTPSVPGVDGLNGWYVSAPTFAANGADAHSGLALAKVSLNGTDWLDSVILSETSGQTIYFRTMDNAGNESQSSASYKYDKTAPSVPGAVSDVSGSVSGTWQKAIDDPNFTWAAATDATSGVSSYLYYWGTDEAGACTNSTTELKYNPSSVAESGTYYLRGSTKDAAGNQSACTTLYTFKYDNIAPTLTSSVPVVDGLNGWYVSAPTFAANGADAHSGLASSKVSLNGTDWLDSVILSETSGQTIYFRTLDNAGNESQSSASYKYDKTPPSVPGAVSDASGSVSGTWQKAIDDPDFTWAAATDAISGVSSYLYYWGMDEVGACTNSTTDLKYNPPSVAESGTYYLRVSTKDAAGNESACTTTYTFKYDNVNPSVNPVVSVAQSNGWYAGSPDIDLGASDDAGIGKMEFKLDDAEYQEFTGKYLLPEGIHQLQFRITDAAGNWVETQTNTYKVDGTPPLTVFDEAKSVNVIISAEKTFSGKIRILGVTTDSVSGVGKAQISYDNGATWKDLPIDKSGNWEDEWDTAKINNGRYVVLVRGIDNAGNSEAPKQYLVSIQNGYKIALPIVIR